MSGGRKRSADRLCEMLAQNSGAIAMYHDEVIYHVQIDLTCKLLDVVDEAADPVVAAMITDLIYDLRWRRGEFADPDGEAS